MIKNKEFKTYNQQMKYLRNSKKIKCKGTVDKARLVRNGYFNLINGYKEPFIADIDKDNDKHIYINGIDLDEIIALKLFDRELRNILFYYLTDLEEEIRAVVAYAFDYHNKRGTIGWYELKAFNQKDFSSQQIIGLISKMYHEINISRNVYLKHYLEEHEYIPSWVLIKVIKFNTLIKLIDYSKKEAIDSILNLYGIENKKILIGSLHWVRITRNACAHNERVFDIKNSNGKVNSKYIKELLPKSYARENKGKLIHLFIVFKYFLPHNEYIFFLDEINKLLSKLKTKIHNHAFNTVRASMGIKDISHLDLLKEDSKDIEYNKFDSLQIQKH